MTPPLPPYVPLKDFQNPLAFNSTWTDEYVAIISNICGDDNTDTGISNSCMMMIIEVVILVMIVLMVIIEVVML